MNGMKRQQWQFHLMTNTNQRKLAFYIFKSIVCSLLRSYCKDNMTAIKTIAPLYKTVFLGLCRTMLSDTNFLLPVTCSVQCTLINSFKCLWRSMSLKLKSMFIQHFIQNTSFVPAISLAATYFYCKLEADPQVKTRL